MFQAFSFFSEKTASENPEKNHQNNLKIQKIEKKDNIQSPEINYTQEVATPVNYEDYFQNNDVSDQKNHKELSIEQKPKEEQQNNFPKLNNTNK